MPGRPAQARQAIYDLLSNPPNGLVSRTVDETEETESGCRCAAERCCALDDNCPHASTCGGDCRGQPSWACTDHGYIVGERVLTQAGNAFFMKISSLREWQGSRG